LGEKNMTLAIFKAIDILWPITYLVGFYVTIKYFRAHNKPVFILLLLYFALGIFSSTAMPYIYNFYYSHMSNDNIGELLHKLDAYQADLDQLHLKYPDIEPGTLVKHVSFPFGQIILVTALYILGVRSKKEDTQPAPPAGHGEAPRP